MKSYITRPGLVLTAVCGEYLLVAAKSAREHCPYFTQLSESAAFLWKRLSAGASLDDLEKAVQEEYEIGDPAAARELIESFVAQMLQSGYLLQKGEEDEK